MLTMSPMPRPPTNTIRYAHRIFPYEVGILPDLHCPTQFLRVCLRSSVKVTQAVAAGDAGPARPFGDAICTHVELISSPMAFFAALWGWGLWGFCGVDEKRR